MCRKEPSTGRRRGTGEAVVDYVRGRNASRINCSRAIYYAKEEKEKKEKARQKANKKRRRGGQLSAYCTRPFAFSREKGKDPSVAGERERRLRRGMKGVLILGLRRGLVEEKERLQMEGRKQKESRARRREKILFAIVGEDQLPTIRWNLKKEGGWRPFYSRKRRKRERTNLGQDRKKRQVET